MTLTVVIGLSSLLFVAAALTGVVINKEGKPAILIKSTSLRLLIGLAGLGLTTLSVYMWDRETTTSNSCLDCESRLKKSEDEILKLSQDLEDYRILIGESLSANFDELLFTQVETLRLFGQKTDLGCNLSSDSYRRFQLYNMDDPDMCKKFKFLMHPVVITSTRGIDLQVLHDSLNKTGLYSATAGSEHTNARSNKNLGIIIPDDQMDKQIVCSIKRAHEAAFKSKNPSSRDQSLKYLVTATRIREVSKGKMVMSVGAIQLGVDVSEIISGLSEITQGEWADICENYTQSEFESFIFDKSEGAKINSPSNPVL